MVLSIDNNSFHTMKLEEDLVWCCKMAPTDQSAKYNFSVSVS